MLVTCSQVLSGLLREQRPDERHRRPPPGGGHGLLLQQLRRSAGAAEVLQGESGGAICLTLLVKRTVFFKVANLAANSVGRVRRAVPQKTKVAVLD